MVSAFRGCKQGYGAWLKHLHKQGMSWDDIGEIISRGEPCGAELEFPEGMRRGLDDFLRCVCKLEWDEGRRDLLLYKYKHLFRLNYYDEVAENAESFNSN